MEIDERDCQHGWADADGRVNVIASLALNTHDLVTAMQAAVIEWRSGGGAELAMQWILNSLHGPGLIPDENAPYGNDAQAWWDSNNSHPIGPCDVCGKPSNMRGRVKACSPDHYAKAMESRFIPDAECKQGKCANETTGCRGECQYDKLFGAVKLEAQECAVVALTTPNLEFRGATPEGGASPGTKGYASCDRESGRE